MPTEKQARFVKYLLGKKGYHSEEWSWLGSYSIKQAGKLIDKLLKPEQWPQWCADFISKLPPPVERPRKQAFLPLPDPEPRPLPSDLPPELAEFKRWAREVFQRGELTMTQLCELQDSRFGNPFCEYSLFWLRQLSEHISLWREHETSYGLFYA